MYRFFRRLADLFRFIFLTADYEPFEFLASLIMMVSGIVLLNPYTDLYSNSHAYAYLSALTSEPVMGAILLFVALNKFFALMDGRLQYRMWVTSAAALIWFFLFVVFLAADLSVWFPWTLGLFCIISAAAAARMHRDIVANLPPWTQK